MVRGVFSIPLDASSPADLPPPGDGAGREEGLCEYLAGPENALVGQAAVAVLAEPPGYNPLLLFGPTGTGKSLLLRGLAARWMRRNPRTRLLCCTGADFARAYADAVQTDALPEFRRRHRGLDLLVLDDLQQLGGKSSAQSELLRTLDALRQTGARFWAAARGGPNQWKGLSAPLLSRLSEGLTAPVHPPAAATRRALLERFAQRRRLQLPPAVLDLLVESGAARTPLLATAAQLNHAVCQLQLEARVQRRLVDVDFARRYLARQAAERQPSVRAVVRAVGRYFHVPVDQLTGPTRRREAVRARGVAMLLTRRLTDMSLKSVGRQFGRRDHTTVLHACRKTESLLETDPSLTQAVEELSRELARAAGPKQDSAGP